ncbi:MAG: PIN domain-containing protein [Lamprobacter sp.]|uniref:type II toxin-antitoxin system VapC family toxin n=1 Tax=Lamprobacter sp. TaxID=3100796 RepID=UPI002B25D687|nr:PIN domain-containing protein [Lamprobacter sp.]MEA3642927.1 PIN domain-containing protein [Lamprobacter sp.]
MQSIFVDTGAWYAAMVRKDRDHEAAKLFLKNNTSSLITSDYVMDETVTLLLSRVGHSYAVKFLDMLQTSRKTQLIYLTPTQISATVTLFRERADKEWSFTDCSSFVLMPEYQIQVAFAFDEHFKQAGFQVKP